MYRLKKFFVLILVICVCMPILPRNITIMRADSTFELQNPRIVSDSSMESRQKVTWDCVWFGSYPQAEVIRSGKYTALDSSLLQNGDTIVSDTLYSKLQSATGWDANGDITIDGEKYRRIKKSDATYATSGSDGYYNWSDSTTYHYFKHEPIKWRVLNVNGNEAFLLADKGLDDQRYNASYAEVEWKSSTIRSWLNGYSASSNACGTNYSSSNFIDTAFSTLEQSAIKSTTVVNEDNLYYGTEGGNDTDDKVFLLSESEVYTESAASYGFDSSDSTYDEARRSKSSTYAKARGTYSSTSTSYRGNCCWWLRSPGCYTYSASYVSSDGYVYGDGDSVGRHDNAIRPALHLNLLSSNLYSYAGTVCSDGSTYERDSTGNSQKLKQKITAKSVTKAYSKKKFSLKVKTSGDGTLTYKSSNTKIVKVSSLGKVTIKGCGKVTITITAAETSKYKAATKKITITIKPKKAKLKKVTSPKKESLKITWQKDKVVTGYQVQIAKSKKFKKGILQRYFSKNQKSITVPLKKKSGQKYYVRIRSYKRVNGVDYFGKWSKVKSTKIK